MKDLNLFMNEILQKIKVNPNDKRELLSEISSFMVDNQWFGIRLKREGKKICISSEDTARLEIHITNFIFRSCLSGEEKSGGLSESLRAVVPETALQIKRFFDETSF
ncbi:MAG: hypothetical protein IJO13_00620, partial [Lachnospiraceae bacterium]|nr:hypothetical protein [Lachnospiraceae bacterium]